MSAGRTIADDDPAWRSAVWRPCALLPPPDDWAAILPEGTSPGAVWGIDPRTGRPKDWPLPFNTVSFSARLEGLGPGPYEFRARAVDRDGFAQPEPRPHPKSGPIAVPCRTSEVTA